MPSEVDKKKRARILCVDDDVRQLELLKELLGSDFDVSVARDGVEGLDVLGTESGFAVIVSDMGMPRMDGAEFLRRARYVAPGALRILLTAHGDFETALRAVNEAYIYQFITKPWRAEELRSVLRRAVGQYELSASGQDKVMGLVFRDDLTGLYNRRYFDIAHAHEHARCFRHARRYALVFFDLDGLKAINTKYGHVVGSHVIESVGNLLGSKTRASDLAFRFGGDEFVTLLVEVDREGLLAYARNALDAIAGHGIPVAGEVLTVTASAGVAILTKFDASPTDVLERADAAMYEAKRMGKNQIVIAPCRRSECSDSG